MDDAISRRAAIEEIKQWSYDDDELDDERKRGYNQGLSRAIRRVKNVPALDVAPVVRCKDCKNHDVGLWCAEFELGTSKDFFCAYGERKER